MIELPRRRFLTTLSGFIAAPAIVRASSIMPVRGYKSELRYDEAGLRWLQEEMNKALNRLLGLPECHLSSATSFTVYLDKANVL